MKPVKTIVLIVGHGAGDSGAMGFNGMSEFNYNEFVAEFISSAAFNGKLPGKKIDIVYRGSKGIKGAAEEAMKFHADLTLELHCNAYNKTAKGCMALTLGDKPSVEMGNNFSVAFCKKFQRTIRDKDGVVELKKNERGAYSLALCNDLPPSILLEPFFIDNKDEWIEPAIYANFLIDWINTL